MRTIKFKAKRLFDSKWVCGYFYQENDNTYIIEDCQKDSPLNRNIPYKVDPTTVCQFTGFLDKNGREIYEGDVLRSDEDPYNYHGKDNYFAEVYWSEYSCGVDLRIQKSPQTDVHGDYAGIRESLTLNFARTFEVIGNIHDKEWQEKLNLKVL